MSQMLSRYQDLTFFHSVDAAYLFSNCLISLPWLKRLSTYFVVVKKGGCKAGGRLCQWTTQTFFQTGAL